MHDVNLLAPQISREFQLAPHCVVAVEALRRVFSDRHIQRLDILHERADSGHAGYTDVESRSIQPPSRIHKLSFGATHCEVREEFEDSDSIRWHLLSDHPCRTFYLQAHCQ